MSGYLRVGDVYQVERITDQSTLGLKGKKDCWAFERFKPFVWQVGKTYPHDVGGRDGDDKVAFIVKRKR